VAFRNDVWFCLFLTVPSSWWLLPWPAFPCIFRVESRCCRPRQDLMQDGIGNDRPRSGHMRRFVLHLFAAQRSDSLCGSFEIWDLGSR
jgi:hypothetical protein